jgi:pimeloyl-ACP methyl ester carboxylesterase
VARSYRSLRRVAVDPRTAELAGAVPRTVGFLAKTWTRSRRPPADGAAGTNPRISAGLAANVLLDEIVMAAMKNPSLLPRGDDFARAGADVRDAYALFEHQGWIDAPAAYHRDPPAPEWRTTDRRRAVNVRYEHVAFPSGFEPRPGEPGRERWLAYDANATVHAWMLRHRGAPRPWLVCVHGFGMGQPFTDFRAFRALQLHRLGLNLLLPVLPLHGPRAIGKTRGEGFMSVDLVDSVHGLAQSAWDVRRAIRWLREEQEAPSVGLYGLSLGGYVAALVSSLEPDLACVIAGIPATDLPELYRRHSPPRVRRLAEQHGALGPTASAVHRVVSPLAIAPLVPHDRRFIFAGVGDRMSTFGEAKRLWVHWDRPRLAHYDGGHVGFFWSSDVGKFVVEALESSDLLVR